MNLMIFLYFVLNTDMIPASICLLAEMDFLLEKTLPNNLTNLPMKLFCLIFLLKKFFILNLKKLICFAFNRKSVHVILLACTHFLLILAQSFIFPKNPSALCFSSHIKLSTSRWMMLLLRISWCILIIDTNLWNIVPWTSIIFGTFLWYFIIIVIIFKMRSFDVLNISCGFITAIQFVFRSMNWCLPSGSNI